MVLVISFLSILRWRGIALLIFFLMEINVSQDKRMKNKSANRRLENHPYFQSETEDDRKPLKGLLFF